MSDADGGRTSDSAASWSSQSPAGFESVSRLPGRSRCDGRAPSDSRPTSTAAASLRSSTGAGKIALAHMKEFPDYYERLERMEAEAELEFDQRAPRCVECDRNARRTRAAMPLQAILLASVFDLLGPLLLGPLSPTPSAASSQ